MQGYESTEEYVEKTDLENLEKGDWEDKLKGFVEGKYFFPIIIVLVATISFFLGRISGLQGKKPPVRIINSSSSEQTNAVSNIQQTAAVGAISSSQVSSGQVVASKSGTKYHYPWCAGAGQISEKNKITFNSIAEARAAGYTPASNCKGLK